MISPFIGKFRVTSPRGYRNLFGKSEYHKGIDLVGIDGKNVYAIADGTIYTMFEKNGFGYYVRQILPDGKRIYYAHLAKESFAVKCGEKVKKGQMIGVMGATGRVTGAHTHLELRPAGSGSDSIDISEFTGIPNAVGEYEYITDKSEESRIRKSYDDTVEMLLRDGIIGDENMVNWELMLAGKAAVKAEYVRALLERYHKKCRENIQRKS